MLEEEEGEISKSNWLEQQQQEYDAEVVRQLHMGYARQVCSLYVLACACRLQ